MVSAANSILIQQQLKHCKRSHNPNQWKQHECHSPQHSGGNQIKWFEFSCMESAVQRPTSWV